MGKQLEDYRVLVPGLEDALDEIAHKLQYAQSTNALAGGMMRYNPAYIAALEEIQNTVKMRLNQSKLNQRPGLWSVAD